VFETPGVEPAFVGRDSQRRAIDYAKTPQGFNKGEIQILNNAGGLVETVRFDNRNERL
jgi:hypothetical protein